MKRQIINKRIINKRGACSGRHLYDAQEKRSINLRQLAKLAQTEDVCVIRDDNKKDITSETLLKALFAVALRRIEWVSEDTRKKYIELFHEIIRAGGVEKFFRKSEGVPAPGPEKGLPRLIMSRWRGRSRGAPAPGPEKGLPRADRHFCKMRLPSEPADIDDIDDTKEDFPAVPFDRPPDPAMVSVSEAPPPPQNKQKISKRMELRKLAALLDGGKMIARIMELPAEAIEEGFEVPTLETRDKAFQLARLAAKKLPKIDFEIYSTEEKEIAFDIHFCKGAGILTLVKPRGQLTGYSVLFEKNKIFKAAEPAAYIERLAKEIQSFKENRRFQKAISPV